jgi:hypothetical protein
MGAGEGLEGGGTGREEVNDFVVKIGQDVTGRAESVMVKLAGIDAKAFIEDGIVFIEVVKRGEREVISSDVIFKHSLDDWYCGTRRGSGR